MIHRSALRLLAAALLFLLPGRSPAQTALVAPPNPKPTYLTPPPAGADSLRLLQYQTLAHLDVSQVPTGLLAEYGMPLVPPGIFDGSLTDSSRTNDGVFRQLIATLATSRVYGANPFPRLDTLMDRLDRRAAAPDGVIPIALARIDYATLRPDAVSAGLLTWQNNQLYDVSAREQSPYQVHTAFVAGPARTSSPTGHVTLLLPLAQYVQVGGGAPQTPEIDFGDGRGYLPAAWDQPLSVTYCDSGTHRIKLRLAYAQVGALPAVFESHFDLSVRYPGCTAARYANGGPDMAFPMAGYTDAGSGGMVNIRYGGNHNTLVKPLIVVEGYDPVSIAPKLTFGNYSVDNFLEDIRAIDRSTTFGVPDFNFRNMLDDDNIAANNPNRPANYVAYDIVFIDFRNGTDDIRANARLFKEVVRWVNAHKQPNPLTGRLEDNVVLGISMGGLVARYGLAQMEKAQPGSTQTRLLMTQDSPHRGANTPLGVQAVARQAYNAANVFSVFVPQGLVVRALFPQLDQVIALANAPATRQLLLLYAEDGTGTTTTDGFLAGDYRSTITFPTGGPQPPYRFVAVSLGSQCGTGTLAPYSELLRIEGGFFLRPGSFQQAGYRINSVVNALPSYGAAQRIANLRLYTTYGVIGLPPITRTIFSQTFMAPANVPGWDGVAGGTQSVRSRLPVQPGTTAPTDYWWLGFDKNVQAADRFCFVPTVSALDINDINTTTLAGRYVGGLASASFSRAANFMAQPTFLGQSNFQHPFFLGRQAHWLFNEMEAVTTQTPLNCSPDCPVAVGIIAGPTSLCPGASGQYTISNLPVGATVAWQLTGGPTPTTGNGPTFTVTAPGSAGTFQVTATLTLPCATQTLTKYGTVTNAYASVTAPGEVAKFTNFEAALDQANTTGPYTWTVEPRTKAIILNSSTATGASIQVRALNAGEATITATGTNACTGAPITASSTTVTITTGGLRPAPAKPAAYPNPADDVLNLAAPETTGAPTARTAVLYNAQGREVRRTTAAQATQLPTADLPEGLYYLMVEQQGHLTRHQIRVRH